MRSFLYRSVIYIAILISFSGVLIAQSTDSLQSAIRLHLENDTVKVTLLITIADKYLDINIDSAIHYASEALTIAGKLNFDRGEEKCKQILGSAYLQKSEYGKALKYFNDAYAMCEISGDKEGQSTCLKFLGNAYYLETRYDTALEYYNKSISVSEEINNNKNIGLVLMNIGIIYNDLGNYPKALEYYQKALMILEKEKYTYGVALCLSNFATLYLAFGDYKKASDYNDQCLSIYERTGDKVDMLSTIVSAGMIYSKMKDYNRALVEYNKGYSLARSIGETYWEKVCNANIAEANYFLGNYDTALARYTTALAQSESAGEFNSVAAAQDGIGLVLVKQGKIKDAEKHFIIALDIAGKNGIEETAAQAAHDLSNAYENEHDYDSALAYYKIYTSYNDSVYNEKNEKRFHQLQFDDELGRKDTRIQSLEKDKATRQKIATAAISMLIMAVTIVILLLVNYQRSKKNLRAVTLLKEALETKNREQDRVLDVVTHDLRSPVSGVASLADIMLTQGADFEDAERSIRMIKTTSQGALILINELMGYRNDTKDTLTREPVDIASLTEETVTLLRLKASEKQQRINTHFPPSPVVASIDREKTGRVLANLVGNAIKFSRPGADIDVTVERRDHAVLIAIKDVGIGIPKSSQQNVFELFTESKRKGTSGEKSYGLGLSIARQIVLAHGGKIWLESQEGKGTTFYVELLC